MGKKKITEKDALEALRRTDYGEKTIKQFPVVTVVNHGVLFTRDEAGRDAYLERERISRRAILYFVAFVALVLVVAIITPPFSQGSESFLGIIKIIKGGCVGLFIIIAAVVTINKRDITCERLENKYAGIGNNLFYDGHKFTCLQQVTHYRCI